MPLGKDQVEHREYGAQPVRRSASLGTRYGIRAARILPFARTSRWAMVGSGTRKARANLRGAQPAQQPQGQRDWALVASEGCNR